MLFDYADAENLMYRSFLRAQPFLVDADDAKSRRPGRTRELLDLAGKPDREMNVILVTGSKGKGSTSHLISIILRALGYKTGLFTSPHLIHFTERIQVNGAPIRPTDFLRLTRKIEPHVNELESRLNQAEYLGPIGLALSVAMLYFSEQKVDFAVIEAGRGGRFDDTNALANEWAVISSIFPEHVDELGPTIDDIAWHKAGIAKDETKTVIVNRQGPSVAEKLKRLISDEKKLLVYGEQFEASDIEIGARGTAFRVRSERAEYPRIHLPLLGSFQAFNAATALAACEAIIGDRLEARIVAKALENARWPGRCEIVDQNPTVIVDGAINAVSAEYVKELVEQAGFRRAISIIGVPEDKDYEGVTRTLAPISSQLIVSSSDHSHKKFPAEALAKARRYHPRCLEISPLKDAIAYAKKQAEIDLVLIVGTQTFIGDAKRLFG